MFRVHYLQSNTNFAMFGIFSHLDESGFSFPAVTFENIAQNNENDKTCNSI